MSRILPVTFEEFSLLIDYAQKHHSSLNEPIPQISQSQYGNVKSCLQTPFQTFGGRLLYKGFYPKAAILFYLLNKNHPLSNGNKRMACLTLGFFCFKNHYNLTFSWEDFYFLAKDVTNSQSEKKDIVLGALEDKLRHFVKKGLQGQLL